MIISNNMKQFLNAHYILNAFLSVIYFFLKTVPPFCSLLFNDCAMELREYELLTFLGCVIALKNRKQTSFKSYYSTVCMFSKMLSLVLFARQSPILAVIYGSVCLLHLAFLPEPAYSGPDLVMYFRGIHNLEEELSQKNVVWIIEFYAAWLPSCVNFAAIFAQLSSKYSLENLKFGKIDVTRFPDVAKKYKISTSSWSKQLPTAIVFENGTEVLRQPRIDFKGKVRGKFIFSEINVIEAFDLKSLYKKCKVNLPKHKKEKANKEKETVADKKKQ